MKELLAAVLLVAGLGWAVIGVANVVMMLGKPMSDALMTVGLLINGVGFVLPGLLVAGMGSMVGKK